MEMLRFTETQIVGTLKESGGRDEGQGGLPEASDFGCQLLRLEVEIWGMEVTDLKRMEELEAELFQYKRMYPALALKNWAMRKLIEKKALTLPEKYEAVRFTKEAHGHLW